MGRRTKYGSLRPYEYSQKIDALMAASSRAPPGSNGGISKR